MDLLVPPHISPGMREYRDPRKTLNGPGLTAGGYIRISTAKDGQATSIENQRKLIADWARANGYILARFYTDVKTGAYSCLRDEMSQMRDDLKQGLIQGIIAKEVSRTSRDVLDVLELKREIASYGGFFLTIKENYDSRTDDDEFFLIIHGGLAQRERKATAGRVKVTQIIKAREGRTNVAVPAFGYKRSGDGQSLVPNPETAPLYRAMVERCLEGWGCRRIALWLNAAGSTTKKGRPWDSNSVKVVLANPVYLGTTIYNATTVIRDAAGRPRRVLRPREDWVVTCGTHPPLIDEETFRSVQEAMRERRRRYWHEWSTGVKYLGSAVLRCAACGSKVYGARFPRRAGGFHLKYRCSNRTGACAGLSKTWDMGRVDRILMDLVKGLLSDGERLRRSIARITERDGSGVRRGQDRLRELLEDVERIEAAVRRQQAAYEGGVVTLEEYSVRMMELRRERQLAADLIARLGHPPSSGGIEARVDSLDRKIQGILAGLEALLLGERMELLRAAFESVYIDGEYNVPALQLRL
ncbi:MAG: recombinase family protein [Bacillota bacterium]